MYTLGFGNKRRLEMIRDCMRFIDFADFYRRKDRITTMYWDLKYDDKVIYKYYIYSRRRIREKVCDAMWEYLNAGTIEELADANSRLSKEYDRYDIGGIDE